jgi:hypothetical protein
MWNPVVVLGVIQNVGRTIKMVSWFDPASSRREQFATGGDTVG